MKLLLFSDLHADANAGRRLVEMAKEADVLVGAGDFGNFGRPTQVCVDVLAEVHKPAVLVAGNHESTDELRAACAAWPSAHVLHGTGVEIGGEKFFGLGGGVPITPFGDWSYDFSEEQAAELLEDCPSECILVTHSPPKGAVDRSSGGQSLGSTAILDVVLNRDPRLVVCGHIHGSAGQRCWLGRSLVVNAGPGGVLVDLSTAP